MAWFLNGRVVSCRGGCPAQCWGQGGNCRRESTRILRLPSGAPNDLPFCDAHPEVVIPGARWLDANDPSAQIHG